MTWQPPEVLHPDVETLLSRLLREALAERTESYAQQVRVGARRLPDWRGRIVSIRRDGGSVRGVLDRPRIAVRVWADDEYEATDLALLIRSLILAMPGRAGITSADHLSGPLAVSDESGPQRYLSLELAVRPL